ncbi:hypothetical protein [Streptomyces sp. GS7]|uniref:hypothetical protein n=1 Tax=Streptomyces sp. GS7 TaxID=2692234 RepID=UPI001315FFA8|nr:hypothetical protein [Streptomyces sp. GS7]QHC25858.1 hypothetical protein GR130_35230 [Streptomyces sp. GS7]
MESTVRVVLKREVGLGDVGVFAYDQHWEIKSITRKGESPRRQVWETRGGDTFVTYLEDPYLELRYIAVQGPQSPSVSRIIHSSLPCWTLEEASQYLLRAHGRDEKIHGIYLLAASSPGEESESILEILRSCSRDGDSEVRRALLVGMGYLGTWAQVRGIAEFMNANDPDETVRRDAGHLLEGLDLHDGT